MTPLSVVVWQEDPRVARDLAASLCHHFDSVHVADSHEDVRSMLVKHRAEVVVLDMEGAHLETVERLHRDFSSVCIVCTHRVADEEMWAAALDVGASDYCQASDTEGILLAAIRNASINNRSAAA
jgi:DNA-binding NarL/FixJ family response regulator